MRRVRWLAGRAGLAVLAVLAVLMAVGAAADVATPPGIRELHFKPGTRTLTVADAAVRGEQHIWRFEARAGQTAALGVSALEGNAAITVWRPGARLPTDPGDEIEGRTLPGAGAGDDATRWHGRLPDSGVYLVVVGATRGNASYRLRLKIQP